MERTNQKAGNLPLDGRSDIFSVSVETFALRASNSLKSRVMVPLGLMLVSFAEIVQSESSI